MLIFIPIFYNYLPINQKNRFLLTGFMHNRRPRGKSPYGIYAGKLAASRIDFPILRANTRQAPCGNCVAQSPCPDPLRTKNQHVEKIFQSTFFVTKKSVLLQPKIYQQIINTKKNQKTC